MTRKQTRDGISFIHVPFKVRGAEISADGSKGNISGYATVYGQYTEWYHEMIQKGAFKKNLKERGGKVPIYIGHNSDRKAGRNKEAKEDDYGLLVEGELLIRDVQEAKEAWAFIEQDFRLEQPTGLSIGFIPINEVQKDVLVNGQMLKDVYIVTEAMLMEYSIVDHPAYDNARLDSMRGMKYYRAGDGVDQFEIQTSEDGIKIRLLDTAGFLPGEKSGDAFRKVTISDHPMITAVVGKRRDRSGDHIHSLCFDQANWSHDAVNAWLTKNSDMRNVTELDLVLSILKIESKATGLSLSEPDQQIHSIRDALQDVINQFKKA